MINLRCVPGSFDHHLAHAVRGDLPARLLGYKVGGMMRFVFSAVLLLLTSAHADERWHFLDNGKVRLGVNLTAGGCIGWFSHAGSQENVLDAYDAGRFLQQSFYGDVDGSDWNGRPWRYNCVQGGSWRNQFSDCTVLETGPGMLKARTTPRHWATGAVLDECVMEQTLRLEGGLAYLRFHFAYRGTREHAPHHQELPALFVHSRYDTLVITDKAQQLQRLQPGPKNEYHDLGEPWCAWVNGQTDVGIGMRIPHTRRITCYRVRNGNKADCSYLAPIQTMALKPGFESDYEVVLALGTVQQIRAVFAKLDAAEQTQRATIK
ncbi:MAG: hypothetical protein IPK32_14190 [Verrucomicrobiaceae bacterium]|nr:hypothetical protein [Verrucomicrobiaceae bacterium]